MSSGNDNSRGLAFYFFIGAVGTVLVFQTIVWILSTYGAEYMIATLRQTAADAARMEPAEILSRETMEEFILYYSRLNVLMFMASLSLVVIGFLLILREWVFSPIDLILEKDRMAEDQRPELIDESKIPANEMRIIIRSRNNLVETMEQVFSEEAIETLVEAVDAKDNYTQGHSRRVGTFGELIGREAGLDSSLASKIRYSGTLHDIGKIGIDDSILTKPGELTRKEYQMIQEHPTQGARIIKFGLFDDDILHGILHHHERFDGTGYPEERAGEEIPLFGRILAVADAVDAMLSDRQYRDSLTIDEVYQELEENKGTQFDPEFADIALRLLTPQNSKRLPELFSRAITNGNTPDLN